MRQMQLQQERAIKETFKYHLLKQASDATGVNISDLRQSSNAETQTNRINSLLRTTGIGNNDVNGVPTSDFGIGNNDVTGMPTSDFGIGNNDVNGMHTSDFGIGDNIVRTHFFEIREDVNTSAATADYEPRIEMHEN